MSLESICSHFDLPDTKIKVAPLGKGLINDTYVINPSNSRTVERFVLQKINKYVFKEPEKVMHNLIRINQHLKEKKSNFQELIRSKHGNFYYIDNNKDYWRVTKYLENTKTLFKAYNSKVAFEAAKSYGKFLGDLHDLPVSEIYETIPKFHNYANRINQLKDAIEKDLAGRLSQCQK
jgi:hypothetical protein